MQTNNYFADSEPKCIPTIQAQCLPQYISICATSSSSKKLMKSTQFKIVSNSDYMVNNSRVFALLSVKHIQSTPKKLIM